MDDCLFCRIATARSRPTRWGRDETLLAFNDINPKAPAHVLIIPRKHISTLNDLSPEDDATVGAMVPGRG